MKKETKATTINVRMEEELKAKIKAIAEAQGKTISELARGWFIECVELHEDLIQQNSKN